MRERTTWIAGCEIQGSRREDLRIVGNLPLRLATAKMRSLNWSTWAYAELRERAPSLKRLATWAITEEGTDQSALFHLTGSKPEDVDVVMTVDEAFAERCAPRGHRDAKPGSSLRAISATPRLDVPYGG